MRRAATEHCAAATLEEAAHNSTAERGFTDGRVDGRIRYRAGRHDTGKAR
ncbi:hypothetical protein BJQ89_02022 [Arthrobacter sp. ES1]|nr:hypothetical protein [Arthrobacter sp. ES1]